jgi:hypothetical protein
MDIIYIITDSITGLKYVGSKKDWQGLGTYYGSPACKSNVFKKYNKQQEWKIAVKERPETFIFKILEEFNNIDYKFLLERELFWHKFYDVINSEEFINVRLVNPNHYKLGNIYEGLSEDESFLIKNKISKSLKDKYSKFSKEELKEKFAKFGEDNPNYGNFWNEIQKDNLSKKLKENFEYGVTIPYNKGKTNIEIHGEEKSKEISEKFSKIASERVGELNPFFGKEHSEESKNKIRESKIGKYFGEQNIPFIIDGINYYSLGEASKKLNIPIPTIRWRLLSKNKKFINYSYINEESK